ncbi:MAG TPA: dihydrofolate reductase family protein [Anaerolineales bacterium]|nr:dihydrofolate reductase family protein [Anaerolineales bacterium]
MGSVGIGFSMSLDGFVAGPHDEVDRVFQWYFTGGTDHTVTTGNEEFKMSEGGAELIEEAGHTTGALITGRRTFDIARAWGGKHPMDVPVVVVTHRIPEEWVKLGSPFTFVPQGVERALEKAREIAGDKNIAVGAPSIAQQCLKAGLIDEIQIDLVPVLLGKGIRLFDHLGDAHIELECTNISQGPGVIHLSYRVVKQSQQG